MRLYQDIAQAVGDPPVKVSSLPLILLSGIICSLVCFPYQPVVHNWSIKGCDRCCPDGGKVHLKDPVLLIGEISICADSGFI